MILTHFRKVCYLLSNLYFNEQYQENIVYILVAVIVVVNVFQLYLEIRLSF